MRFGMNNSSPCLPLDSVLVAKMQLKIVKVSFRKLKGERIFIKAFKSLILFSCFKFSSMRLKIYCSLILCVTA